MGRGGVSLVVVVKCRVSINGEIRGEERRTGAGQCRWTMPFQWWGGGGREREQSASWGRDIGVSNKQTTDTNTSAAWGYS